MKLLELKRIKRTKEKARKDEAESKKNFNDYAGLEKMFHDDSRWKLKVTVLYKYLNYPNLGKYSNKKSKLEAINIHVTQQLYAKFEEEKAKNRRVKFSQKKVILKNTLKRLDCLTVLMMVTMLLGTLIS